MITEIRKTAYADIPAVMTLFDKARQTMAALGIDQWQDGYPFESNIRADVLTVKAMWFCVMGISRRPLCA